MHPYTADKMVKERQQELLRLARAERSVRNARRTRLPAWRRVAGRALVAATVAVGVPRGRRRAAQRRVTTALGFQPPC